MIFVSLVSVTVSSTLNTMYLQVPFSFVLVLHLVPPQPLEVWLKEAVLLPHLAVCHKGVSGLVDLERLVEGEEGLEELVQVLRLLIFIVHVQ